MMSIISPLRCGRGLVHLSRWTSKLELNVLYSQYNIDDAFKYQWACDIFHGNHEHTVEFVPIEFKPAKSYFRLHECLLRALLQSCHFMYGLIVIVRQRSYCWTISRRPIYGNIRFYWCKSGGIPELGLTSGPRTYVLLYQNQAIQELGTCQWIFRAIIACSYSFVQTYGGPGCTWKGFNFLAIFIGVPLVNAYKDVASSAYPRTHFRYYEHMSRKDLTYFCVTGLASM